MRRGWIGWGIVAAVAAGCTPAGGNGETFGANTLGSPTGPAGSETGDMTNGDGATSSVFDGSGDGSGSDGSATATTGVPSTCGDGVVEGAEACDDSGESATCNDDCTAATCGDGIINASAGEICDDGGESAACDLDCTPASCGDMVVNATAGETCDAGFSTTTCDFDCTAVECGDGVVNVLVGEECDDGPPSMACDSDCTPAMCGDGLANAAAGEDCDDMGESATCDEDCTTAACGDGTVNATAGETCDDGMPPASGDGCSATCQAEVPLVCDGGADPFTGSTWVVCAADANSAWISHSAPGGGNFHSEYICSQLGYASVGGIGGTCGNVCGYCEGATSCMAPGNQNYDGGGSCGSDANGQILCITVMWQCLNP